MIQSPRPGPGDMSGDWGNLLNTLAKLFSPILPIEKRSIRSRAAEPICCLVPLLPQPQLSHKHCIQSSPSNKPPLGGDLRPQTGANTVVNTRLELTQHRPRHQSATGSRLGGKVLKQMTKLTMSGWGRKNSSVWLHRPLLSVLSLLAGPCILINNSPL